MLENSACARWRSADRSPGRPSPGQMTRWCIRTRSSVRSDGKPERPRPIGLSRYPWRGPDDIFNGRRAPPSLLTPMGARRLSPQSGVDPALEVSLGIRFASTSHHRRTTVAGFSGVSEAGQLLGRAEVPAGGSHGRVAAVGGIRNRRIAQATAGDRLLWQRPANMPRAAALLHLRRAGHDRLAQCTSSSPEPGCRGPGRRRPARVRRRPGRAARLLLWQASAFPAITSVPRTPARTNVVRCRIINVSPGMDDRPRRALGPRPGRLSKLGNHGASRNVR